MSEFNINEIREKMGILGDLKIQELAKSNVEVEKLLGEATSENGLVEFLEEMNENNDDSVTQAEIEAYAVKKGSVGNLQSLIDGIKNIFEQIMSAVGEVKPKAEAQTDVSTEADNAENAAETENATEVSTDTPIAGAPIEEPVKEIEVPLSKAPVVTPPVSAAVIDNEQNIADAKEDSSNAIANANETLETLTINKKTYTRDIKNNDALKNYQSVETVSLPTFNSQTSKYLDPSFETALSAKQARIKALNNEILVAIQKEQNDYATRYKEIENAKKKLAELEAKLKQEGISDEDKTKLKDDIASLEKFINGGVNGLDSSVGSIASKIQERTNAISDCKEIVKLGDEQAKQISDLVDKAQGVNLDSKIAEIEKIEIKKTDKQVDISGDRKDYYFPEDEKNVNARNKSISDAQLQADNAKKEIEATNNKLKTDKTALSKMVGDISNMSAADRTKALETIKGLAGGILTAGDVVNVNVDNYKNAANNVNLSVEQYNLAVQTANTNINVIKKAIEDAKNVEFADDVDYYAGDIKIAKEDSVNTKDGRDKYYTKDDKDKVEAKQKAIDEAKTAREKAKDTFDANYKKLQGNQTNLDSLIASLSKSSGGAKTAALNEIKQLAGTIITSGETIQNNIEEYKTAKSAQSSATNSYNDAVKVANSNIDEAVEAARKKAQDDAAAASNGATNGAPAAGGASGVINGAVGSNGVAPNGAAPNGAALEPVKVNPDRKEVKTEKIENPDGTITTKITYDDESIKEETKTKDGILTSTKEIAKEGNYSVVDYDKDGKKEKSLSNYNENGDILNKTEYTYVGEEKLPKTEIKYDGNGNELETKTYTYDKEGKKTNEKTVAYTIGENEKEAKTTTDVSYDEKGKTKSETITVETKNDKGKYEKISEVKTTYEKDEDGRVSPNTVITTYKEGVPDTISKNGIMEFAPESKELVKIINKLYNATANKWGTDEDIVKGIILGEGEGAVKYSDAQMVQIMQAYEKKHGAPLIKHIQNDFSGGDEDKLREKLFEVLQNEATRKNTYDAPASKKVADCVEEFNRELNSTSALNFMAKFVSDEYTNAERVEILTRYSEEYGANPIKDITEGKVWFGKEDGYIQDIFAAYLEALKQPEYINEPNEQVWV